MSAQNPNGGLITAVAPGSLAETLGIVPGDILLTVNGEPVEDVIDVQYYAAEYVVEVLLSRNDREIILTGERDDMQSLGMTFKHPTFDVDIRRCNNLCEFCFVHQMAPHFRQTLYVKDDDFRHSFLYGNFVTLTNLSKHDEWRIVNQHLNPLYVSVHATDVTLRRKCLRNDDAPDILEQLSRLASEGIEFHTQIVVTPGLNDGEHLKQSVDDLSELYPGVASICVVPVGLTKYHKRGWRTNTEEEANVVIDTCHTWQAEFHKRYKVNLVYPTDEWYLLANRPIPPREAYDDLDLTENGLGMVRRFLSEWSESRKPQEIKSKIRHLTLVTGVLFEQTLVEYAADLSQMANLKVSVHAIRNNCLGDTITVAGLLMGEDVINQLIDSELGDVIVLPQLMFAHHEGMSLDDKSPLEIARELRRPVALANNMGELFDILNGQTFYYDPASNEVNDPVCWEQHQE